MTEDDRVPTDGAVPTDDQVPTDGRRARRDRNRAAVIEAVYGLLAEGARTVATEAVAERAGVSVSSVFRYFDGLDDLLDQTIEAHLRRMAPLLEVDGLGEGTRTERLERLVDARLRLYEAIAPVARTARARAIELPPVAERLAEVRRRLRDQLRAQLAPELAARPRPAAEDLLDAVDALTSFESWDLLGASGRSARRIRRAWVAGLDALTAAPSG